MGIGPCVGAPFEQAGGEHAEAVALEARRLVELRDRWQNLPEWVEWVDEAVTWILSQHPAGLTEEVQR